MYNENNPPCYKQLARALHILAGNGSPYYAAMAHHAMQAGDGPVCHCPQCMPRNIHVTGTENRVCKTFGHLYHEAETCVQCGLPRNIPVTQAATPVNIREKHVCSFAYMPKYSELFGGQVLHGVCTTCRKGRVLSWLKGEPVIACHLAPDEAMPVYPAHARFHFVPVQY